MSDSVDLGRENRDDGIWKLDEVGFAAEFGDVLEGEGVPGVAQSQSESGLLYRCTEVPL